MSLEMSKKISWYRSVLDKIANENRAFELEQKKKNETNGSNRKGKAGSKETQSKSSESGAVAQDSKKS